MKKDVRDDSIFSFAARQSRMKKKTSPQAPPLAPPPKPKSNVSSNPSKGEVISSPLSADETRKMLQRMHQLQEQLASAYDNVINLSGVDAKLMQVYLDSLSNVVGTETKNAMAQPQTQLEKKIWSALGIEAKEISSEKQQRSVNKRRKAKSIGARRNWIWTK